MSFRLEPGPVLPRGGVYRVAYSGGLDSTVLLHSLQQAGIKPLRAIHVHHGLQARGDAWLEHCRKNCRRLKIPFVVERVTVEAARGEGPEAAARGARYAALRKRLKKGDCLVTAHHADDQAETFLLRLLRGSGVQGLAAMRELTEFSPGLLWRPLLDVSRQRILDYALAHQLKWVEDPHNRDPRYARSWLRAKVLPLLKPRYPALSNVLVRSAQNFAQATELLDEMAHLDLCVVEKGQAVDVTGLLSLKPARRNNLLRYWLARQGHELPPAQLLARLEKELLRARADAEPAIAWGHSELRRYRDSLWVMARLPPPPASGLTAWSGRRRLDLPKGSGELLNCGPIVSRGLSVGFAQGGEKLKPVGDTHTRTLKNLCQQAGIPPWVRVRMPLVFHDGKLIAVADLWHSRKAKTLKLKLFWRHPLGVFFRSKQGRASRA